MTEPKPIIFYPRLQKRRPAGGTIGEHTHRTSTKLKVCTNYIVLTPLIGVLQ